MTHVTHFKTWKRPMKWSDTDSSGPHQTPGNSDRYSLDLERGLPGDVPGKIRKPTTALSTTRLESSWKGRVTKLFRQRKGSVVVFLTFAIITFSIMAPTQSVLSRRRLPPSSSDAAQTDETLLVDVVIRPTQVHVLPPVPEEGVPENAEKQTKILWLGRDREYFDKQYAHDQLKEFDVAVHGKDDPDDARLNRTVKSFLEHHQPDAIYQKPNKPFFFVHGGSNPNEKAFWKHREFIWTEADVGQDEWFWPGFYSQRDVCWDTKDAEWIQGWICVWEITNKDFYVSNPVKKIETINGTKASLEKFKEDSADNLIARQAKTKPIPDAYIFSEKMRKESRLKLRYLFRVVSAEKYDKLVSKEPENEKAKTVAETSESETRTLALMQRALVLDKLQNPEKLGS